jgi:hypothetical protein
MGQWETTAEDWRPDTTSLSALALFYEAMAGGFSQHLGLVSVRCYISETVIGALAASPGDITQLLNHQGTLRDGTTAVLHYPDERLYLSHLFLLGPSRDVLPSPPKTACAWQQADTTSPIFKLAQAIHM